MQVSGLQDQGSDASDSLVFGIGSVTLPAQPLLAVQLRTLPPESPSQCKRVEVDDAVTSCQGGARQADIGKTDVLPLSNSRVLLRFTSH